jgi:hypothetical protein
MSAILWVPALRLGRSMQRHALEGRWFSGVDATFSVTKALPLHAISGRTCPTASSASLRLTFGPCPVWISDGTSTALIDVLCVSSVTPKNTGIIPYNRPRCWPHFFRFHRAGSLTHSTLTAAADAASLSTLLFVSPCFTVCIGCKIF